MKIVQVTPRYPPHTGGVEKHVKEISETLVENGHEVTVLTADADGNVGQNETQNGVDIHRYRSISPNNAFHVAPSIAVAVQRVDADVVHAHNYHSLPVFLTALQITDEQFVVTPHYHGESASNFRDKFLSLYQPLGRWALRQADEVIAVSKWERDQLDTNFNIKATIIPNGLNVEQFSTAEPEDREQPYILCVGRLERYKGIQHAIQALSELPRYDLLVAGSGPYREKLEEIARNTGVTDRVEFLGYVAGEHLPSLYAGAEVYLTLSSFEAYGMTVAEALSAGTPCVVRETRGLTDWTAESGVTGVTNVVPKNVATAIEHVAGESIKIDLLNWNTVTAQVTAAYCETT